MQSSGLFVNDSFDRFLSRTYSYIRIEVNDLKNQIDCLLIPFSGSFETQGLQIAKQYFKTKHDIRRPMNPTVACLGTYLNKKGLTFDCVNSFEDDKLLIAQKLQCNSYLTVGISTTFCDQIDDAIEMIRFVRAYAPDSCIILGGPTVVNYINAYLHESEDVFHFSMRRLDVQYVIHSFYGEEELFQIIQNTKSNRSITNIPNLFYKKHEIFHFTYQKTDVFDLRNSVVNWGLFRKQVSNVVSIRTTVSCQFSCSFCSYPINAGKFSAMPVAEVEMMLKEIDKQKEIELVHFIDDTFNVPVKRFREILNMMSRNHFHFKWFSYIRCQFLDDEIVGLMKKSGCIGVFLGIESGSEKMLRIMNKCSDVKSFQKGIALLNQYSIINFASFIIGYPGETQETIEETISFIEQNQPTFYSLNTWVYDTRTPINERREEFGLEGVYKTWRHNTMTYEKANQITLEAKSSIQNSILDFLPWTMIFQLIVQGVTLKELSAVAQKLKTAGKHERFVDMTEETHEHSYLCETGALCRKDEI